jgi:23S rRNA (adenine-N6)-dimethyltransferase
VPGRPPPAPNPAGAHFLRDRALLARLVRASGAGAGRLALDLGAGHGVITAALASSGASVIAVERDPRLAAGLRRRFAAEPLVRVSESDLRQVRLPRTEFLVVASPPFSLTTALCRRLLGDPAVPLAGAELIIQRGAARWLASERPRDAETAWWAARYELRLAQPVSRASFVPPPGVDVAVLSVRPRPLARSAAGQRVLRPLLREAYRHPVQRAETLLPGRRRLLIRAGVDPRSPGSQLTAAQWHELACLLAGTGAGKPDGMTAAPAGRERRQPAT